MPTATNEPLVVLAHAWDRAMIGNDPREIAAFMTDDWIIVGAGGQTAGKAEFLNLIASGELTHDEMASTDVEVRRYGDAALVLVRGTSGGTFRGFKFREHELATNVFLREGQHWRCALTHLSRLPEAD